MNALIDGGVIVIALVAAVLAALTRQWTDAIMALGVAYYAGCYRSEASKVRQLNELLQRRAHR